MLGKSPANTETLINKVLMRNGPFQNHIYDWILINVFITAGGGAASVINLLYYCWVTYNYMSMCLFRS